MASENSTAKSPTYQAARPVVLGLVGLDYFSTLAYQPSIGFEAAGLLAPLATAAVVLLTCLGALPVYAYVAGRANPGQGSFGMLESSVMLPIHPGGRVTPDDKEAAIRQIRGFDRDVPLIFVEVIVGDASEFSCRPLVEIQKTPGRYMVRVTQCVSVAHVLFAIAHEFSKVGQPPELHFGWSDQTALAANLKFLLFGEGNIPFLVNDLLRRHEPDHKKRPRVVIG